MTPDIVLAALLVAAFVAACIAFAGAHRLAAPPSEPWLPGELQNAELAYAEQTFRSERYRLVARLDRAYRLPSGLRLLELKTRPRNVVYMDDIIELSVQRIAVQDQTGQPVSSDAWVIVEDSDSGVRRPHRVRLLDVQQVAALRSRYQAVVGGRVESPASARSLRQCEQCGHRARCSAAFGDR